MNEKDFVRDEHGNIQYLCDGEVRYPTTKPITAEWILQFVDYRKKLGMKLSQEEIDFLWKNLSE